MSSDPGNSSSASSSQEFVIPPGFSLGAEQAELDALLDDAFYLSGSYGAIESFDDSKRIMVGRTGSGKSAILTKLHLEHPDNVINLNPRNLSLDYILNEQVFTFLKDLDVELDLFWVTLWKHVLLIEIIKNRYTIDGSHPFSRFIETLKESLSHDRTKTQALDYLEKYEDSFWQTTDERVRHLADGLKSNVTTEVGTRFRMTPIDGTLRRADGREATHTEQVEMVNRFRKIVNTEQSAHLRKMIDVLDSEILRAKVNRTYVVIDDLDEDWVDKHLLNDLLRALFKATRELVDVRNLKVVIALRSNLLRSLNEGPRGLQREKYEPLQLNLLWTRASLGALMDLRAQVAAEKVGGNLGGVADLLPADPKDGQSALAFVLDRTLMRPRDAIRFVNIALERSPGTSRISWEELVKAELIYSRSRLDALHDEWNANYPDLDVVLRTFHGGPAELLRDDIESAATKAALVLSEPGFKGIEWLKSITRKLYEPGSESNFVETYGEMLRLLFGIGFMGCRVRETSSVEYYYDDPDYLASDERLGAAHSFVIHPIFRRALDIGAPDPQLPLP